MSSVTSINLCRIQRISSHEKETICEATLEKTSALVMFLIGMAFLASGLYLHLGGIGTIPAITGGTGLIAGGAVALITVLLCKCRQKF